MALSSAISSSDPFVPVFAAAEAAGRAALVPYLTAGFPDVATSRAALQVAARWGDVIELGVPFSDPLADGPTIQRASHMALKRGMTLAGTLALLHSADIARPVVLFTYLNPVLAYGLPRLLVDAAAAGVTGLLLTDLPAGADESIERQIADSDLPLIRLVAPTTPDERLVPLAREARGFLYLVSRLGVTGARRELAQGLAAQVARLRAHTDLPVAVGFGVSDASQAATVAGLADGVVVGSALVRQLDERGVEGLDSLLAELRGAMERAA